MAKTGTTTGKSIKSFTFPELTNWLLEMALLLVKADFMADITLGKVSKYNYLNYIQHIKVNIPFTGNLLELSKFFGSVGDISWKAQTSLLQYYQEQLAEQQITLPSSEDIQRSLGLIN